MELVSQHCNETSAAKRMRKMRARRNIVTPELRPVTKSYTEIDLDLELEKEREEHPLKKTDKPKKPKKDKFGDFVLLTEEEHQKLVELMGEEKTDLYIENLNNYVGQHGRKYKSHYYTIRNWYRRDEKENKEKKQQSSPKQSNNSIYDTGFQLADGVLTPEGVIKKD